MARIKEAAFRDNAGKVVGTGSFHDISRLPLDFRVSDEGFLDDAGTFLTREEASAGLTDHPVESEEVLGKSLKEYEFVGPYQDPTSPKLLRIHVTHPEATRTGFGYSGKPGTAIGSLTFSAEPVVDEHSPYHGYHRIGEADVHPDHRGNGLYGRMLHLASMHVKRTLHSKGLVSPSEWRSEDATGAWEKAAHKTKVLRRPGKEGPDFFMSEKGSSPKKPKTPEWWRRTGRISLDEASKGFKHIRITPNHDGSRVATFHPSVPTRPVEGENTTTPRVSLAPSIWHAVAGVQGHIGPKDLKADHREREDAGGGVHEWHIFGLRTDPEGHVPNKSIWEHVPDAHLTGESWATKPVTMEHIGIIGGDFDKNGKYDMWVVPRRGFGKFGKSEDETSPEHIQHEFLVEFKRWLTSRSEGKPFTPTANFDLHKAEAGLADLIQRHAHRPDATAGEHATARQIGGADPSDTPEFRAARFLVGGKEADEDSIRTALALYDNDHELAALRAYGLPRNDEYRAMLRAVIAMEQYLEPELKKSDDVEPAEIPRDIQPATPDAKDVAEAVVRAQNEGAIEPVQLDKKAKHSKGTAIASDPDTGDKILLKPGSGSLSPAAGVRDELATQSQREAAFYHLAKLFGIERYFPRAELLLMDGKQVAALEFLSDDYETFDKVVKQRGVDPVTLLRPYLDDGTLYKWAFLDWVAGNADRHANNAMVNEQDESIRLIDHGSAFAGKWFDPAFDAKSFIPFYLRAWSTSSFAELEPEERVEEMPKLTGPQVQKFGEWIDSLSEPEIAQILGTYGIGHEATMGRFSEFKAMPAGERAQAIVDRWAGFTT
jgi:hypothetical protein